jgi:antitoxin component HigA of HigAB toxin-antitoxin module
MEPVVEYADQALSEISEMFLHDNERPTPWRERLSLPAFDYSVDSLSELNAYLNYVRKRPTVESVWNIICLRAGAYLGEVIRRHNPAEWHWISYDEGDRIAPSYVSAYGKVIGNAFVLSQNPTSYCYPLAKVDKYLTNGSEDNTQAFARVIIDKWSEKAGDALYTAPKPQ